MWLEPAPLLGAGLSRRVLLQAGSRLAAGGPGRARRFSNKAVLVEKEGEAGIAVMKFKNPPVNSSAWSFRQSFRHQPEKLENEKSIRGVILTSERPGTSPPPHDMKKKDDQPTMLSTGRLVPGAVAEALLVQPDLISAINGAFPAGGCLMALTCDYRIMADNSKYTIGLNESLLGIVAPFWLKDNYVNTSGTEQPSVPFNWGRFPTNMTAAALLTLHRSLNEVVPEDQVHSKARSVMAKWFTIPDHSRLLTKSMMRKATADNLIKQREADIQNFTSFTSRDSIQKSLHVYLEKLKQKKG
uniref:Delta3, delta2-enoyl-CoA isomerase n=1 Tax=Rattus norvegicus TaxID=10116 RepID=Q64592_RAT|nr:delta3, delta2-enoyl-CoA isomerase precursor [Rattus norvegicus]